MSKVSLYRHLRSLILQRHGAYGTNDLLLFPAAKKYDPISSLSY